MERRKFFTHLGMGALATCAAMPLMSNNTKAMETRFLKIDFKSI